MNIHILDKLISYLLKIVRSTLFFMLKGKQSSTFLNMSYHVRTYGKMFVFC